MECILNVTVGLVVARQRGSEALKVLLAPSVWYVLSSGGGGKSSMDMDSLACRVYIVSKPVDIQNKYRV